MHHEDGKVSHHLGGGRDLHDVAQHVIDGAEHLAHLVKAGAKAQRLHLGTQVGVLAARNLIAVDFGERRNKAVVKVLVAQTHVAPVVAQTLQAARVKPGVALLSAQRLDKRVERGLAGEARQRRNGAVDNIHAGLGGHQVGGNLVVGGVVAVQVNGHANLLLERLDQLSGGIGLEQAGHVLDADGVGPRRSSSLAKST